MRLRSLLAAGSTLALFIAGVFIAVSMSSAPGSPPRPVQRSGTAAGQPHRVPATQSIGQVVDGKVVPATAGAAGTASRFIGPAALTAARVPGAVPQQLTVKRLQLPVRGKPGPEKTTVLTPATPAKKAGYDPKTSKQLPVTAANQVTYSNADGTRTLFDYAQPVNYRTASGTWATINTTLIPAAGQRATSQSASPTPTVTPSALVTLPPSASAAASGASAPPATAPAGGWTEQAVAATETFASSASAPALVTLPAGSGSVSFGIAGAAPVAGTASGSTVTYAGVFPDAGVSYTAGSGTVKEELTLASPSAPATWTFPLHLTGGLRAQLTPDGSIDFISAAGAVVAVVPHGSMTDSKTDPRTGEGATSTGVTYSLVMVGGQQAIRMTLDTAWLDSSSRVYPVTVDPSVSAPTANSSAYWTYPATSTPGGVSGTESTGGVEDLAGTADGSTDARTFLNFSGVASALNDDTVLGARLGLFDDWSWSCSPRPVDVYQVTSSWTAANTTSPVPSTGTLVGEKSFAHGWVSAQSNSSSCPATWEGINLSQAGTDLVNGWTHNSIADDGLAVAASPSDTYGWKRFATGHNSAGTGTPFLAVTYTTDGASYSLASRHPVKVVTPSQAGSFAIHVVNTGSTDWAASTGNGSGYEMSYVAYNAKNQVVANHPVFTGIPAISHGGGSATVDVNVNALTAGYYRIVFSMYSGATSFTTEDIQDFQMGLYVPEPPPVVTNVYPPTGFTATTLSQSLSTTATASGTIKYDFTLTCEPLTGQTCMYSTIDSGSITEPYWTPPASQMQWDMPYQWQVVVTGTSGGISTPVTVGPVALEANPPQPLITSSLGGSSDQAYDPLSGNYTTSATDAAIKVPGPALEIDRVYNSMDPQTDGAFGAGWSTIADASLTNNTSTVTVTLPSGQEMVFGYDDNTPNTGVYAPPEGSPDVLVHGTSGTWTLKDASGNDYVFFASGAINQIIDPESHVQSFTVDPSNQVTKIQDGASGRYLALTWSGTGPGSHVSSVTTSPVTLGGTGYTWTYSYTGNNLTQVCAPATVGSGCTTYSYGSGSNYQPSVLDANPRSYWQLGDAVGATTAADEVDANLGTTDGTYSNVTLGAAGPLAGSSETAAAFNGTSSSVTLPANLVTDSTDEAVGLWFKMPKGSTSGGVLFSADNQQLSNSTGYTSNHEPVLYVGTDGLLRGEFWTGSAKPITSTAPVNDGNWHYAVLSAGNSTQTLYLDGQSVGTLTGAIDNTNETLDTVGAGFWTSWPEVSGNTGYFTGDIGQVAFYSQPLPGAQVAQQYALGTAASPELTQVTLPSGKVYESVTYDSATARVATYRDKNGGEWRIGQPAVTGIPATSDSLGKVLSYVTVQDPAGRSETYGYDLVNGGRIVSYTNGVDPPELYGYDAAGNLAAQTDGDGNLTCYTNDIHGNRLTKTWYPVEPSSLPGGGVDTVPSCAGSASSNVNCPSNGLPCTTFYHYTVYDTGKPLDPDNDKLTGVVDGRSGTSTDTTYLTQYAYDSFGQQTTTTTPEDQPNFPGGRVTTDVYSDGSTNTDGSPSAGAYTGPNTTDPSSPIPPGLLVSETTPGGGVTTNYYASNGDLMEVKEPSGRYTIYSYDLLGRVLTSTVYTSTDPGGAETQYTYDALGDQLTVTSPPVTNTVDNPPVTHQLEDTYAYDADGNKVSLTQSDIAGGAQADPTRTTTWTYNNYDQVASETQPGGATTGGTAQSQGAASANPQGATTGYEYDGFGNVSQVTDPNSNQYRFTYNEYQEQTSETLYTASQNESTSVATCTAPATQDPDGGCDLVLKSSAYDPAGLLAATTDAMGRITNYTYDHDQELIEQSQTDLCSTASPCTTIAPCTPTAQCTTGTTGTMTVYTYDGAGDKVSQAVSMTRSGGVKATTTTNYTYDPNGWVLSQTVDAPPSGATSTAGYADRTTSYTYDADGHVATTTVGTGSGAAVTSDVYNPDGTLASQTVQDGTVNDTTSWTYDQNGQPLTETSPLGNVSGATAANYTTTFAYDANENLVSETGAPVPVQTYTAQTATTTQPVTTYGYDTFGDQTQAVDPDGNLTFTTYDGDGRPISVTKPSYTPPGATSSVEGTTTYGYDEDGNVTSVTAPDPSASGPGQTGTVTTSYAYDALGDRTSATQPQVTGQSAAGTTTYTYDADGEQLSVTSPLGHQTSQTYDYFGQVATSTDALGHTTNYGYDYLGDKTMTDTPDGSVTTATFDGAGDQLTSTDGAGNTSSLSYDPQGQIANTTKPDGSSEAYGYDQAGNLTTVTDYGPPPSGGGAAPQLRQESFGYDANGEQTSAKDWDGNTATTTYDADGHALTQVQPVTSSSSITESFGYDAAGNQTLVTSGKGNQTWTTYNPWNQAESVIEPPATTGQAAANRTWTTTYNGAGLQTGATEPGGVSLTYGYDQLGDLLTSTGSGGTAPTAGRSFTYDLDGRMTSASTPAGTDSFTYYNNNALDTTSGPSGSSTYTYNGDGLPQTVADAAGTTSYTYDTADRPATEQDPLTGATETWAYNADSNPTSVSYTTGGTQGPVQAYGYNGLQQLTSDTVTSASGTLLASEQYGYDSDGNVTSQQVGGLLPNSQVTYTYDEASRLTSSVSGGTTTSYGYDADGNLTQDGSVTSNYNGQDQVTSSTSSSGTTSYSYDPDGSLASQSGPSGTTAYTSDAFGQMITAGGETYGYDALGRLTTSATSSATTSMAYAGTSQQIASDGSDLYAYDPSGNETSAQATGGTGYQVLADQHGDVTATFSPSATASTLAGWATYSPWGTATVNGTMPGTGYQGDYTDSTTGLVHMGARWYDPSTGAFTSTDTINGTPLPITANGSPYAYANANPLTETDPSGHGGPGTAVVEAPPATWDGPPLEEYTVTENYWVTVDGVPIIDVPVSYSFLPNSMFQNILSYWGPAIAESELDWALDQTSQTFGPYLAKIPNSSTGGKKSSSNSGGGGGGGCTPIICPPRAPQPPPKPKNCFVDQLCKPTPAPGSLTNTQLITAIQQGLSSIDTLFGDDDGITEKVPDHNQAPDGTKPSKTQAHAANQDADAPEPDAGGSADGGNDGDECEGQMPLWPYRDGELATPEQMAASRGGPTAGQSVPTATRDAMIAAALQEGNGVLTCWRCGMTTTNPANVQIGHANAPRTPLTGPRGNLDPANLRIEGAACNSSAQNRGAPSVGKSCAERGGCGAGYGRYD